MRGAVIGYLAAANCQEAIRGSGMNAPFPQRQRPITIAILAMGGEGGGVLADWIVGLAEHNHHIAQLTSVPGVAQRTGATIYYLELYPRAGIADAAHEPVLALMPTPGDVDIVIASELMEAGRAIQRGLITPDRTTLIASTNRVFAMTEKIAMADGRVDPEKLVEACRSAAKTMHAFDMAAIAEATGSVISAVLFGAIAVRACCRSRGRRSKARSGAAERACRRVWLHSQPASRRRRAVWRWSKHRPRTCRRRRWMGRIRMRRRLCRRRTSRSRRSCCARPRSFRQVHARSFAPASSAQPTIRGSITRSSISRGSPRLQRSTRDGRLITETARQLALGMAYEDTIRVAELKIRPSRFERVREEVRVNDGQILEIAEFMHPRTQEIADTLPAPLGRFILNTGWVRGLIDRMTRKGRVVKTSLAARLSAAVSRCVVQADAAALAALSAWSRSIWKTGSRPCSKSPRRTTTSPSKSPRRAIW